MQGGGVVETQVRSSGKPVVRGVAVWSFGFSFSYYENRKKKKPLGDSRSVWERPRVCTTLRECIYLHVDSSFLFFLSFFFCSHPTWAVPLSARSVPDGSRWLRIFFFSEWKKNRLWGPGGFHYSATWQGPLLLGPKDIRKRRRRRRKIFFFTKKKRRIRRDIAKDFGLAPSLHK